MVKFLVILSPKINYVKNSMRQTFLNGKWATIIVINLLNWIPISETTKQKKHQKKFKRMQVQIMYLIVTFQ